MNKGQAAVSEHIALERLWLKMNEACNFFGIEVTQNKSFIQLWTECVEHSSIESLVELREKAKGSSSLTSQMLEIIDQRLKRLKHEAIA